MIAVIYWSGTGNTKEMAELIVKGIGGADEVVLKEVAKASTDDVVNADKVVLGCPAMGAENLEEDEMEPFVESIEELVAGKKLALFGSYDWGDGEWMQEWQSRMADKGAVMIAEGLIVNGTPEDDSADLCVNYGKTVANFK
ncbi:MAG: flavodoxin [Epulopiscium sp. Nele67-Bin002]|nr:MAG: flavodoxin [Epulopiscium sp. Nuni2H_MBin001]OON91297.1 MAG: flavodoxin [Epulopiscium sp. Nele67-Bin002]